MNSLATETTNSTLPTNSTTLNAGNITFTKTIGTKISSTFNEPSNENPPKTHHLTQNGFGFSIKLGYKPNSKYATMERFYFK